MRVKKREFAREFTQLPSIWLTLFSSACLKQYLISWLFIITNYLVIQIITNIIWTFARQSFKTVIVFIFHYFYIYIICCFYPLTTLVFI